MSEKTTTITTESIIELFLTVVAFPAIDPEATQEEVKLIQQANRKQQQQQLNKQQKQKQQSAADSAQKNKKKKRTPVRRQRSNSVDDQEENNEDDDVEEEQIEIDDKDNSENDDTEKHQEEEIDEGILTHRNHWVQNQMTFIKQIAESRALSFSRTQKKRNFDDVDVDEENDDNNNKEQENNNNKSINEIIEENISMLEMNSVSKLLSENNVPNSDLWSWDFVSDSRTEQQKNNNNQNQNQNENDSKTRISAKNAKNEANNKSETFLEIQCYIDALDFWCREEDSEQAENNNSNSSKATQILFYLGLDFDKIEKATKQELIDSVIGTIFCVVGEESNTNSINLDFDVDNNNNNSDDNDDGDNETNNVEYAEDDDGVICLD